jgi:hypothetical protein
VLEYLSPANRAKDGFMRALIAEEQQLDTSANSLGKMTRRVADYSRQCKGYLRDFAEEYPQVTALGLKGLKAVGIGGEALLVIGACSGPQGLTPLCWGTLGLVAANHSGLTGKAFDQLNQGVAWGLEQGGARPYDAQEVAPWLSGGTLVLAGSAKTVNYASSTFRRLILKPLIMDYSTIEAAYSLRIDPLTLKGPMAVDSRLFTKADSYTKFGAPRNQEQFWRIWESQYPGALSVKNLGEIKSGYAPAVDAQWLKHFPEHQHYSGQILEHHHLEHGFLAVPLPQTLHRKSGNYFVWHPKIEGSK